MKLYRLVLFLRSHFELYLIVIAMELQLAYLLQPTLLQCAASAKVSKLAVTLLIHLEYFVTLYNP